MPEGYLRASIVLPFQVVITMLAFIAASILALLPGNVAIVSYHVIFALGIVPLILAAMVHFVPVLTRSKSPGKFIRVLPAVALCGGISVTGYFAFPQAASAGHYLGAAIILMTILCLGYWAYRSGSKAIGTPHPCLDWYLAAMACLLLAVCAILAGYFVPTQRAALRMLHLHLNTLGFVGITALGTLQVLLPTVAQRVDIEAAIRMRKHLKWIVAGTVMAACSAAWYPGLSWVGMALLAIPVIGLFNSWLKLYAKQILKVHGSLPALAAALCGYGVSIFLGVLHAYHYFEISPVVVFVIAFIMPLVTGAVSYLLPLWLRPGRQTDWHQAARNHLGLGGGLRALIFLVGGVVAGAGNVIGWYLAAMTAGVFFIQTLLLFAQVRV